MIRSLRVLLAVAALTAAAPPAPAQGPDTPVSSADSGVAAPLPAADAPAEPFAGTGLPEAAPPPRTLRAHWHVFVAFALAWILLFGYALVLGRRFRAVEREVRRLEDGDA